MSDRPDQPWRTFFRNCLIGLGVACVCLALLVFMLAPIGPGYARAYSCPGQLEALVTAMQAYTLDNGDVLPTAKTWQGKIRSMPGYGRDLPELVECAEAGGAGKVSHVMLSVWGGLKLDDVADPWRAIILYDAADGRPVFRRRTFYTHRFDQLRNTLARPGLGLGYVDGHAAWRTGVGAKMIAEGRDTAIR